MPSPISAAPVRDPVLEIKAAIGQTVIELLQGLIVNSKTSD